MKAVSIRIARLLVLIFVCSTISACDDPQVYGSVGVSSYSGGGYYGGGTRVGTSVTIGGRIR